MGNQCADFSLIDCRSLLGGGFVPEWIKVKPVVGREPRVVFQAIDITLCPALDFAGTSIARQGHAVSKLLEENFVSVPTAVETEKQNDRTMHDPGEEDRPRGKGRGRTEELTTRRLIAAHDAVAQHPDGTTVLETLLHAQQSVGSIRCDDCLGNVRVQRVKKTRNIFVVRHVHQHLERKMLLGHSDRAQDFETAEVRAQKNAAFTTVDLAVENFPTVHGERKLPKFAAQQVNAIENRRGEKIKGA